MLKLVVNNTGTEPEGDSAFQTISPAKTVYIICQNQILAVYN